MAGQGREWDTAWLLGAGEPSGDTPSILSVQQDADIAVEEGGVGVVCGDQHGAAVRPFAGGEACSAEPGLDPRVDAFDAVGAAPQGAQDADLRQGGEGFGGAWRSSSPLKISNLESPRLDPP